jgi:hypothetical protein
LPQKEEPSVDAEESFDEAVPEDLGGEKDPKTVGETDTDAKTMEVDSVEELTSEAVSEGDGTESSVDLNEIFKEDGENE